VPLSHHLGYRFGGSMGSTCAVELCHLSAHRKNDKNLRQNPYLPGYKGPDVYPRGVSPESEAMLYLDELEQLIRQWIAVDFSDQADRHYAHDLR
jgi:hypothetical protein